jgi:hypothetical protein
LFTETIWKTEFVQIAPGAIAPPTMRATTLQYVELLRKNVTGGRSLSTPAAANDLTPAVFSEVNIIEGLALELYIDHHNETWVVAPERFFDIT